MCHSTSFSTCLWIMSFKSDWLGGTNPLCSRTICSFGVTSGCQLPSKGPIRSPLLPRGVMCFWTISLTPFWRGFSNKTSCKLHLTSLPSKRQLNLSASNQARFFPRGSSSNHWKKGHNRLEHLKNNPPGFLSEWDMVIAKALQQ